MMSFVPLYKRVQPLLGTLLEISVKHESNERAHALITVAFNEARRLEEIFNVFSATSELGRLNRAAVGSPVAVSRELGEVFALGSRIETLSSRAFRLMPACEHETPCYRIGESGSITRTSACTFDLGGIAKGYIVDRLFHKLADPLENRPFSVNAGGDLRCQGEHCIEIRVPTLSDERRYQFGIEDHALASSALRAPSVGTGAARYVGRAGGPGAVTVLHEECAVADALTKTILFGGWGGELSAAFPSAQVLMFDRFGNPLSSVEDAVPNPAEERLGSAS
jgi:thiamine biosynthesis lipoprotein ApbE